MATLSATFADDLSVVDGTVDSISALSAYIRLHSAEAADVVQVRADRVWWQRAVGAPLLGALGASLTAPPAQIWLSVLESAEPARLLHLLYLANDVMQTRRAGGSPVFASVFAEVPRPPPSQRIRAVASALLGWPEVA